MESIITLNESLDTPTFYGVNNQNMMCLRNQYPDVRVVARGYQVKVYDHPQHYTVWHYDGRE